MAKGILVAAFDFSTAHEDEFHDWYDLEHVPERQRVPGFGQSERWISVQNPKHAVASYELDSPDVLHSPAYLAIGGDNLSVWSKRVTAMCNRLVRYEGEQCPLPGNQAAPAGASALLLNFIGIDPEHESEFNDWYDQEHIPSLSTVPGTLCARRYRDAQGSRRYLAIYHLANTDVPATDAWKRAAHTPWTERMRPRFRNHLRILTHRYRRTA